MKKLLLFTLVCLVIGVSAEAKVNKKDPKPATKAKTTKVATYKVEKAQSAFSNGNDLTQGDEINGNSVVEIMENGFLMFVDNVAKKRYYVSRACKAKVKDLVAMVKKPKSISKAFLENMMTMSQKYAYSSVGNVERDRVPVSLDNVETDEKGEIKVYMIE